VPLLRKRVVQSFNETTLITGRKEEELKEQWKCEENKKNVLLNPSYRNGLSQGAIEILNP
jgi:hypothetical protein